MANQNEYENTALRPRQYKLGIALSGGGVRGLAHAGALMAIEEAGLKPDIIAGVSAGAFIGALYAAGAKPMDILKMFLNTKFSDFTEFTLTKGGFFKIDKFIRLLEDNLHGYKRLEELPIPTFIGVTNFDAGCAEAFSTGDIAQVVKASCSIPIAIPPVVINGVTYVDGGVLRNLPAWVIRNRCEKLIGINVSPMMRQNASADQSVFDVAARTYSLLTKSNQNRDMEACDLMIVTREISHYNVFSLKDINKIFISGYANARKKLRENGMWHPADSAAGK